MAFLLPLATDFTIVYGQTQIQDLTGSVLFCIALLLLDEVSIMWKSGSFFNAAMHAPEKLLQIIYPGDYSISYRGFVVLKTITMYYKKKYNLAVTKSLVFYISFIIHCKVKRTLHVTAQ